MLALTSRVKRTTKNTPGVKGPASHLDFHSKYLKAARARTRTAVLAERTRKGNALKKIRIYSPRQIDSALNNSRRAFLTPKETRRINVEVGDHYLFSTIDYFNSAHFYAEALVNALGLKNVVRTTLTDDVHRRPQKTDTVTKDTQRFARWVNLRGKKIHNLTESNAQKVFMELKKLCSWTQPGECKYYDAILYIRKLGLEKQAADFLSKKYGVSSGRILRTFSSLPEMPSAEQAIVVLPSVDEHGQQLAVQQNATKNILTFFFGVPKGVVQRKIKNFYFDPNKIKGINGGKFKFSFFKASNRKLSSIESADLSYRTLTLGKSTSKQMLFVRNFLRRSRQSKGLTKGQTANRLVFFNELVNVLNQFPKLKKLFQAGQLDAIGDFHSTLVKTLLSLQSELTQRKADGLISSQELLRERTFQQVIGAAEETLIHSLKFMGCERLVA